MVNQGRNAGNHGGNVENDGNAGNHGGNAGIVAGNVERDKNKRKLAPF